MIVVGDSGPLLYLGAVGSIDILRRLYGEVSIPPEVQIEVVDRGAGQPGSAELAQAISDGWVIVRPVQRAAGLRDALLVSLDPGEANALALAVEMQAQLLLVDDRKARAAAAQLKVPVKGTLGVLLAAKAAGVLPRIAPVLQRLQEAGLYLHEALLVEVLTLADERSGTE